MNGIKVKVLNQFPNPINGKKAKVGDVLSVPENGFWLKRLQQKDVELVKQNKKASVKPTAKKEKGVK